MPNYIVSVPVTALMQSDVIEASDFDEAENKFFHDGGRYPTLCEHCVKKFRLATPDDTGVAVRLVEELQ